MFRSDLASFGKNGVKSGVKLLCLIVVFLTSPLQAQKYLVLETEKEQTLRRGDLSLEHAQVSPASTFKVVLAWAGIESGTWQASSLRKVGDTHVPGSPRELSLAQAMFYSSNDYFYSLGQQLGHERLSDFVERSGLFSHGGQKKWVEVEPKLLVRGGSMKTTPRLNHAFMNQVALGKLTEQARVQSELEKALSWPSPDPSIQLFGKTGTVNGAVWFNGFGRMGQRTKVVTVFIPGSLSDRPRAIQLFYESFGLKWTENLSPK
jgi:beta-lactamase class D